uniref:proton channel OTOP1-like n=1 Tax=Styela clava TaxID=7725 RepID=UPI00193A6B9E|nr:proton channel OTOP1-like [Styela clava]
MDNGDDGYRSEKQRAKIVIKSIPGATTKSKRMRKCKYDVENANSEIQNISTQNGVTMSSTLSRLCSGIYSIHLTILSLIICLLHYVSHQISEEFVKLYFTILYITCCIWIICTGFLATSFCRRSVQQRHISANHTTNRWLKALLILFGIGIVVENALEFMEYVYCPIQCAQIIAAAKPIAQAMLVIAQIVFLIHFSKVCLLCHTTINRLGIMHIIATNLSVWILLVIMEISHKVHYRENYVDDKIGYLSNEDNDMLITNKEYHDGHEYEPTTIGMPLRNNISHPLQRGNTQKENCTCDQGYCDTIYSVQAFLYPFVIEFSLIASCLSFVIWKNVGSLPPQFEHVIKPNYNFFKSYKGFIAGSFALVTTVVFVTLFGTTANDPSNESTGYIVYHLYLIIMTSLMLVVSVAGIFLMDKDLRTMTLDKGNLDIVVIFITLSGCVALNICSIFYDITVNKKLKSLKIVLSSINILQNIAQVLLIYLGMMRNPMTTPEASNTAQHVLRTMEFAQQISNDPLESEMHIRHHLNRVSGVSIFKNIDCEDNIESKQLESDSTTMQLSESKREHSEKSEVNECMKTEQNHIFRNKQCGLPGMPPPKEECLTDENISSGLGMSIGDSEGVRSSSLASGCKKPVETSIDTFNKRKHSRKIPIVVITKSRVIEPNRIRLYIRDIAMFLLISNACLWIFATMYETRFDVFHLGHQTSDFSLPHAIINMICFPLSIFFRMHSSACLFEVWSYA